MDTEDNVVMGFLILAVGIPGFTLAMKFTGLADNSNPLWLFLSTITYIELGILTPVLVFWLVGALSSSKAGSSAATRESKPEPTAEDLERMERDREERARRLAEHEEAERRKAEERERERLAEQAAKQEEERLRLDLKRTRSFDAALETALEDF